MTPESPREPSRPAPRLPLMVDVADRLCSVVGGGAVAADRARTLRDHGARLRVVAADVRAPMAALDADGQIEDLRVRRFVDADLDGCFLVVAATDDATVNEEVCRVAAAAGVICNAAGAGRRGDALLPAVTRRGPLALCVSTEGGSPRLARLLRERLESQFGPEWGALAELIGELRPEIEAIAAERRRAAVERMADGIGLAMLAGGADRERVKAHLRRELAA
jgi:precorrin-2 dehydrogenase/sirohydrochlorin ferrochelatase